MAKTPAQIDFLTNVRPVVCEDGRLYGLAPHIRKAFGAKIITYQGSQGARVNAFHFSGPSSSFPFPLITSGQLEELSSQLSEIFETDREIRKEIVITAANKLTRMATNVQGIVAEAEEAVTPESENDDSDDSDPDAL